MTSTCCDICGALRPTSKLAPYYVGEIERRACEAEECREVARFEIRTGWLRDDGRRAA